MAHAHSYSAVHESRHSLGTWEAGVLQSLLYVTVRGSERPEAEAAVQYCPDFEGSL